MMTIIRWCCYFPDWLVVKLVVMTALCLSFAQVLDAQTSSSTTPMKGAPTIESTSPSQIGLCSAATPATNPLTTIMDPNNCARYVVCLTTTAGYAYDCPAGYIPGPSCVKDVNMTCTPPCTLVQTGCFANISANISLCAGTNVAAFSFLDDPDECGLSYLCLGPMGGIQAIQCPSGYRSNGGSLSLRCIPDYTCTEFNNTRTPLCLNYTTGCPANNTIIPLPICQNFTTTFGIFNSPTQCGQYMVCVTSSTGFLFQCPIGYSTQATPYSTQRCVQDPSCPTPISPRTNTQTGCPTVSKGCEVAGPPINFPACNTVLPGTNIDDPTRCGYYEQCASTTTADQYYCPIGFRASTAVTPSSSSFCVPDSTCIVPETPRLTVTVGPASTASPRSPPGGSPSGGSSGGNGGGAPTPPPVCNNRMYGCIVNRTPQPLTECSNSSWSIVPSSTSCSRFILCEMNSNGVLVQCPYGYQANVRHGSLLIGQASCMPQASCNPQPNG